MDCPERRLHVAFLLFLHLLSVSCVTNQKTTVSWCVLSDAEEQKCLDLAGNATARNVRGTLQCVRGLNTRDCMDKIKNGTADAASMFGDDIYAAGFCHGLELAAGESHNGVVVGNFFGYSCVPGVKDPQHDPRGNNPKNLCEAVSQIEGKNQESWALDLELEDLKLLCPDGTEAGLDEYARCHLAAVPANAVVVRMEDKCRVWKYLERLQNVFGNATEGFSLFSSAGYGQSDLLFSDATHHLQRVLGSYTSWLGPTYTTMLQAFECEGFC